MMVQLRRKLVGNSECKYMDHLKVEIVNCDHRQLKECDGTFEEIRP